MFRPEGEVDVVGGLDGTRVAADSHLGLHRVHLGVGGRDHAEEARLMLIVEQRPDPHTHVDVCALDSPVGLVEGPLGWDILLLSPDGILEGDPVLQNLLQLLVLGQLGGISIG